MNLLKTTEKRKMKMNKLKYLPILIYKEYLQILKDKSVFILCFALPVLLVIIYGSAIRMEIKPVSVCIVTQQQNTLTDTIVKEFLLSDYFITKNTPDFIKANEQFKKEQFKVLIHIREAKKKDISSAIEIEVYINGVESQLASISLNYINSTLQSAFSKAGFNSDSYKVNIRNLFNEANESVWFLMSGHYVSILTLLCMFLGSFVISREWDRKTIETLCATNASATQIVLSKIIVYYALTVFSLFILILTGQWLYRIPISGSILLSFISLMVYALEMLCFGIFLSAKFKNQFNSAQISVVIGFLPAVMLSGLIFDLRAVTHIISFVGHILPPTYQVKAMRILFLSGGQNSYIVFNILLQFTLAVALIALTIRQVKKDCK